MYMISSVKMRRAMREVEKTEPFFRTLKDEISEIFLHIPETTNRYFKVPDPASGQHKKRGILLVTSDKGFAGAYNKTALDMCEAYIKKHPETEVFIIGEYGRKYFESRGLRYVADFRYSSEMPTVWKARRICADLLEYFDNGKADEISVIYTDFISGRSGICRLNVILPLKKSRFAAERGTEETTETEFFPDPDTVLAGIIPSYITGFIYGCLVDSYCCEQMARMSAMNEASKNAEEMLSELRVTYNKLRQEEVTREMTEITSGTRSLRLLKTSDKTIKESVTDGKRQ